MILTHYHHKNDRPFQTLSSLAENEALDVIRRLSDRTGAVYRRFDKPEHYLRQRKATEQWVRQHFIEKGGQPETLHPQYFVVEKSVWIEEGFEGNNREIQIPLSAFNPEQISFTYPDSMISYWLKGQTNKAFYNPEYHGQVFRVSEIREVINRVGVPQEEWRTDETRKFDLFIEVQVWGKVPKFG